MRKFLIGLIRGTDCGSGMCVFLFFFGESCRWRRQQRPCRLRKRWHDMALHARMDKELPKSVPIAADEAGYVAGAKIYKENCAVCHGLPGQQQTAIARECFLSRPC